MTDKKPEIGDVWQRKDQRRVHLVESENYRGVVRFKLKPLDGGRASWKDQRRVDRLRLVRPTEKLPTITIELEAP